MSKTRRISIYGTVASPSPKGKLVAKKTLLKSVRRLAGKLGGLRRWKKPVPSELKKALKAARGDYRVSRRPKLETRRVELVHTGSKAEFKRQVKALFSKLKKKVPKSKAAKIRKVSQLETEDEGEFVDYEAKSPDGADENEPEPRSTKRTKRTRRSRQAGQPHHRGLRFP